MKPNAWKIEGQIIDFKPDELREALVHLCSPTVNVFAEPIDSVDWTISTRDSRTTHRGTTSDIPKIVDLLREEHDVFVEFFHKDVGEGKFKLERIPIHYLKLSFIFSKDRFAIEVSTIGEENARYIIEKVFEAVEVVMMKLPDHHKYLQSYLSKAFKDHPDYSKNVFLIIRYRDEKPFPEILASIKTVCQERGLNLLRADDKEYTPDLWDNVMTYMYCCSSAVAVFDEINSREFNPNVSIEAGFMLALGKPLLLLKDQAITAMPSDIVGKIYRPFNTFDLSSTITPQLEKWLSDYSLGTRE